MSSPASPANLQAVRACFEENFRTRWEMGASVSIWQHGQEVLNLAHGHRDRAHTREWDLQTLVPVWSATKGPAAVCCLLALEEAGVPLECPVAEVWPEFVGGGKSHISFLHLLSHTAGLCALDERVPIYNYDANAAAKNFVELTGDAWENKLVAFLCSAGGHGSFMSIMALANSLMLDFRCVIVPRFVYTTGAAFAGDKITDAKVAARVAECARATARLAAAVKTMGG